MKDKKKIEWTRVEDVSPYVKSENMSDPSEDYSLARRVYSPKGKKYPLLCFSIFGDFAFSVRKEPLSGIRVSVSYKEKAGAWWESSFSEDVQIPLELFSELEEMLAEIKTKFVK